MQKALHAKLFGGGDVGPDGMTVTGANLSPSGGLGIKFKTPDAKEVSDAAHLAQRAGGVHDTMAWMIEDPAKGFVAENISFEKASLLVIGWGEGGEMKDNLASAAQEAFATAGATMSKHEAELALDPIMPQPMDMIKGGAIGALTGDMKKAKLEAINAVRHKILRINKLLQGKLSAPEMQKLLRNAGLEHKMVRPLDGGATRTTPVADVPPVKFTHEYIPGKGIVEVQ